MYTYYVLRRSFDEQTIELDGDIEQDDFPGVDLDDGPAIISFLTQKLRTEGNTNTWEECDLTDSFFNLDNTYILFHERWIRRSDAPWRKDRNN